jgi:outer membrane lipoprotein SlyB
MKYLFLLLFITSCASRPQLYPNQRLKSVGKESANKDVDLCIADAEEYLESSKGKQIAKGAGSGAAVGAAMGAAFGLFTGNLGRGLVRGSAVGAAGGGAAGALSPDQIKRNYVNHCLKEKGYHVIGWD